MVTDAAVERAARALARIAARATGWTEEDVWKVSGNQLRADAREMLEAAHAPETAS